jgi:hypothetical protein
MSDPFAEDATPWWRRLKREDRRTYAPRPVAAGACFVGGIVVFALPSHDSFAAGALVGAAAALPAGLIESWYKRRHRREGEVLFVLPTDQQVATKVETR